MSDPVNHPKHYNAHPSGIEAITVCEHMSFNVGNAMKYLWRADLKGSAIEDLKKAAWYINREIERRGKFPKYDPAMELEGTFLGRPIDYWRNAMQKLAEHGIDDPSQITKIIK